MFKKLKERVGAFIDKKFEELDAAMQLTPEQTKQIEAIDGKQPDPETMSSEQVKKQIQHDSTMSYVCSIADLEDTARDGLRKGGLKGHAKAAFARAVAGIMKAGMGPNFTPELMEKARARNGRRDAYNARLSGKPVSRFNERRRP